MPFSGTTYTYPSGATSAAPGLIVQSAVWNNIHTDSATALTMLMSQLVVMMTDRNALNANGSFEVWQRGAGAAASIAVAASTTAYTADRWYIATGANQAHTISAQTGLSTQSRLSCRVQRNASETGVTALTFGYPFDLDEIYRLRGSEVSVGFLAQAGANWSPVSGTLTIAFYTGTGAVAKRGAGFTGEVTVFSIATNLTAGGAVTTISGESSVIVPTNATQAEVQFTWTPVGTAGANDYVDIDDVQIEPQLSTSTWTPTKFDRISFDEMLYHCKRHYQKTFSYNIAPVQNAGFPGALVTYVQVAATMIGLWWQYPVEMRATASNTTFNPAATANSWINASVSVSVGVSIDTTQSQSSKGIFIHSANTSSPAAGTRMYIHVVADAGI